MTDLRSIEKISQDDYNNARSNYLTSHALADFRKSPEYFRKKKLGLIPDEDKPQYRVGRALHCLILEGVEEFRKRYLFGGPINNSLKNPKPYGEGTQAFEKAFWETKQDSGRDLIHPSYEFAFDQMVLSVQKHEKAKELLGKGDPEITIRGVLLTVPCQCRIDWIGTDWIVDLKTCEDIHDFERDAKRYGYIHQMAFYNALATQELGGYRKCYLIAVEKKEPYTCGVWQIPNQEVSAAAEENDRAINEYVICLDSKDLTWPTRFESVRELKLRRF